MELGWEDADDGVVGAGQGDRFPESVGVALKTVLEIFIGHDSGSIVLREEQTSTLRMDSEHREEIRRNRADGYVTRMLRPGLI